MNPVEEALTKQMQETEPALDTSGADRKIIQIAYQDLTNYMKFNWQQTKTETDDQTPTEKMTQTYNEDPKEFETFLAIWANLWLKKWKKRVKILIGNQTQNNTQTPTKKLPDPEPLWQKLTCKQEMTEIIALNLIKNGEICGTELLAENLIKIELTKKPETDINKPQTQLAILNTALTKAREASQSAGPTLFMRVNNIYFETQKH